MFGEGRHPHIERLFETKLAPFLSQSATHFWRSRLWYFKQGLYYQGGMVSHSSLQTLPTFAMGCLAFGGQFANRRFLRDSLEQSYLLFALQLHAYYSGLCSVLQPAP